VIDPKFGVQKKFVFSYNMRNVMRIPWTKK